MIGSSFLAAPPAYMREQGRGEEGFVRLDEITTADLDTVFRRITAAKGREWGLEDYENMSKFNFLPKLVRQLANPTDHKDVTQTFRETTSKIKRKCDEQRLPERYLITTSGAPGALRYGIRMRPSERITWDDQAPPSATP